MWPTSPIRETQLHWLAELGSEASPVFWQSWFLYPHTGVAELQPGVWDFSEITPLLQDMLNATQGRELVLQFGTVPAWMESGPSGDRRWDFGKQKWNTTQTWNYKGNFTGPDAFRNESEVAEYFANFMAYFTAGGFTDSRTGERIESGLHYNIPWFEYGNEMEYHQSPESFTRQSDLVTAAVAAVAPKTKFLGLGLSQGNYGTPSTNNSFFEFFLNQSNHAASAPPSTAIDYHYYVTPSSRTNLSTYHEMFAQGDAFVEIVKGEEAVRKRLSPQTKTYLKELGVILHGDPFSTEPIPDMFWSASAAYWAYLYSNLALLQIDVAGMSQLVGGPNSPSVGHGPNYPSVTMLDWKTGNPTARWFVLKMLVRAFGNRLKKLVRTTLDNTSLHAQAFEVTENDGTTARKLLLVNKQLETSSVSLDSPAWRCAESINGDQPWSAPVLTTLVSGHPVHLGPFGVSILTEARCR